MSTNYGKKNVAHKGSNHGAVAPGAMSLGRQAVADPTNPKAQGSGQSYVDPAGNWHHQSTLIPTFANGAPNPQYDPVPAKGTHIEL
jgi:hypothetical protein